MNYADSTIGFASHTYRFSPRGRVPQQSIVTGGAEAPVRKRVASTWYSLAAMRQ